MQFPVPVSALQAALPHLPPMVWVDEVLAAGPDGGTCAVDVRSSALYVDAGGRLLTFAPVEWLAQAYGYARACHELCGGAIGAGARRAFLVGVSSLELTGAAAPRAGRLLLEVRLTRELPPLALVQGSVRTEGGVLLAAATLKLYFER